MPNDPEGTDEDHADEDVSVLKERLAKLQIQLDQVEEIMMPNYYQVMISI